MVRASRRQASLTAAAKIKEVGADLSKEQDSEGSEDDIEDLEYNEEGDDDSRPVTKSPRGRKPMARKSGPKRKIKEEIDDDDEYVEYEDETPQRSSKGSKKQAKVKEEFDENEDEEDEEEEVGEEGEGSDEDYNDKDSRRKRKKTPKTRKPTPTKTKKAATRVKSKTATSKKRIAEQNAEYDLGAGGLDLDDPVVKEREVVLTKIVNAYPREQGYLIPDLMRACDRAEWDFEKAKVEVENDTNIQAERVKFLESRGMTDETVEQTNVGDSTATDNNIVEETGDEQLTGGSEEMQLYSARDEGVGIVNEMGQNGDGVGEGDVGIDPDLPAEVTEALAATDTDNTAVDNTTSAADPDDLLPTFDTGVEMVEQGGGMPMPPTAAVAAQFGDQPPPAGAATTG